MPTVLQDLWEKGVPISLKSRLLDAGFSQDDIDSMQQISPAVYGHQLTKAIVFYDGAAPIKGSELETAIQEYLQDAVDKITDQTHNTRNFIYNDSVLKSISDGLCLNFDADVRVIKAEEMMDYAGLDLVRKIGFVVRIHPSMIDSYEHRENNKLISIIDRLYPA